ncbi:MAG: hypothetical protein FJZ79_04640 [Chlorobi bacterium]|nr:hypothetical protein [Chlorobiota bacterium]
MKKPFKVAWAAGTGSVLGAFGVLLQSSKAIASEADLVLPDLHSVSFLGGIPGYTLLMGTSIY